MNGRPWTQADLDYVREWYEYATAREIGEDLGRSVSAVHQVANKLGLTRKRVRTGKDFERRVRTLHAREWTDTEIAAELGCERHTVGDCRKRLGLPHNAYSQRRRRQVAEKTREQCRRAGVPSLGALRVKVFRERARQAGWPEDLRPRAVQMLNALWDHGPMTRRELADAIGMPWKGSRKSLVSNDPEGSYLAHLMKRGLVISLGRIAKGKGRGRSVQVYSLPLWIERKQA